MGQASTRIRHPTGFLSNVLFTEIIQNTMARRIPFQILSKAIAPRAFGALLLIVLGALLSGCVSFQSIRIVEGREIADPGDTLEVGRTTLGQVLSLLGAPDKLVELQGKDLLVYERMVLDEKRLSLGIPVADIWGARIDFSSYGTLIRYDTLALFFSPNGVLQDMVLEKGSIQPFLKVLFTEM